MALLWERMSSEALRNSLPEETSYSWHLVGYSLESPDDAAILIFSPFGANLGKWIKLKVYEGITNEIIWPHR